MLLAFLLTGCHLFLLCCCRVELPFAFPDLTRRPADGLLKSRQPIPTLTVTLVELLTKVGQLLLLPGHFLPLLLESLLALVEVLSSGRQGALAFLEFGTERRTRRLGASLFALDFGDRLQMHEQLDRTQRHAVTLVERAARQAPSIDEYRMGRDQLANTGAAGLTSDQADDRREIGSWQP
ncbi:MAG: hypothetical protein L0Z62_32100 [Gemmataceae bacterium]|nr:hypothetical protein [Gemmataceae bacterium]